MQKTYLVTGASRGIGKAIAQKLIHAGYSIIGIARSFDWDSPNLKKVSLDLSRVDLLPEALDDLKKEIGDMLQGMICCAGKGRFGSLEEFSFSQITQIIHLNVISHIFLLKAFVPFLKRKKEGDIVMIGSEAALQGKRQGTVYCASKFALRGFCQALREECASSGVRVTLINPGMVKTSFFDHLAFSCGDQSHEHLLPEDIAQTVLHVLQTRQGAVFDEINLSPQVKKIIKS
jgi:short-subunit dehydrogenase